MEQKGEQTLDLKAKVEKVLDEIRPALWSDGGDCQVADIQNGTIYLRLVGACLGCPSASITLAMGIERALKEAIPEVEQVVAV